MYPVWICIKMNNRKSKNTKMRINLNNRLIDDEKSKKKKRHDNIKNKEKSKSRNIILDFSRVEEERCNVYPLLSESACNYPLMKSIGRYVNSCNGLLFFYNHSDGDDCICNPTTNESKIIPPHPYLDDVAPPGFMSLRGCAGFGFDSRSNDYKIMMYVDHIFVDVDADGGCDHGQADGDATYVELYSLKTDSWKTITDFPPIEFTDCGTYADGCCYWIYPAEFDYDDIVSFDFADETFSSFSVKHISASLREDSYHVQIVECGECLGLVAHKINSPCFELWVNTAGRWNKRWDFSLPQLNHEFSILGFSKDGNGEFFYLATADNEVFAYDCAANHLEKLQIHLRQYDEAQFISYVETTVSPDKHSS